MTDSRSREKSLHELEFNDLNIHLYLTLNYGTASEHLDFDFMVLYNAFVLSWGLTITQNSIHTISDLDRSRLSDTRSAENYRIRADTDPEYRIDASLNIIPPWSFPLGFYSRSDCFSIAIQMFWKEWFTLMTSCIWCTLIQNKWAVFIQVQWMIWTCFDQSAGKVSRKLPFWKSTQILWSAVVVVIPLLLVLLQRRSVMQTILPSTWTMKQCPEPWNNALQEPLLG